jgi:hypothetical protein
MEILKIDDEEKKIQGIINIKKKKENLLNIIIIKVLIMKIEKKRNYPPIHRKEVSSH